MKALVKLYGTLPDHYPGTYPESGLEVEIGNTTSVAELVKLVGLTPKQVALVSINDRLGKAADLIPADAHVKFFQPFSGG